MHVDAYTYSYVLAGWNLHGDLVEPVRKACIFFHSPTVGARQNERRWKKNTNRYLIQHYTIICNYRISYIEVERCKSMILMSFCVLLLAGCVVVVTRLHSFSALRICTVVHCTVYRRNGLPLIVSDVAGTDFLLCNTSDHGRARTPHIRVLQHLTKFVHPL